MVIGEPWAVHGRRSGSLSMSVRPVLLPLPTGGVDALPKIPAGVEETDADHGQAEVRRALEIVASQDAETARVERQRLVKPELRREVGNRRGAQRACLVGAPRPLRVQVLLQPAIVKIDPVPEREFLGQLPHGAAGEGVEQGDRVVVGRNPTLVIQLPEHLEDLRVPVPPQVERQFPQPALDAEGVLLVRPGVAECARGQLQQLPVHAASVLRLSMAAGRPVSRRNR